MTTPIGPQTTEKIGECEQTFKVKMQKLKLKGRVLTTSLPAAADDVGPAAETGTCSLIAVAIGTTSSRPRPPPTEDCGGRMSTAVAAAGSREEMSQLLRTWGLAR